VVTRIILYIHCHLILYIIDYPASIDNYTLSLHDALPIYAEVARLYQALTELVEPVAIGPWFVTPNAAFGGLKPIEVIERGEIDRLWEMVYRLRAGMPG